jgi:hypothetical protein
VFYDGSFIVCAAEIEHSLRKARGDKLAAIDISRPDFQPGTVPAGNNFSPNGQDTVEPRIPTPSGCHDTIARGVYLTDFLMV